MDRGYRTIFWGVFFATFHINLGPLPILPQFVGWIIVAVGIGKIQQEYSSATFRKAGIFAPIIVVLALFSGVYSLYQGTAAVGSTYMFFSPILFGIIEFLMEYAVLEGSVQYFESHKEEMMADEYIGKLRAYSVVFITFIILESIILTFYIEAFILIVALIGIVLRIWFMIMMSSLKKEMINNNHSDPPGIDLLV